MDQVHREDRRGGVVVDRLRHEEERFGLELLAEEAEVLGFSAVVELVGEGRLELQHHVGEPEPPSGLGVVVEERGELLDDLEVVADLRPHAGSLDLDGDARPSWSTARWT